MSSTYSCQVANPFLISELGKQKSFWFGKAHALYQMLLV